MMWDERETETFNRSTENEKTIFFSVVIILRIA